MRSARIRAFQAAVAPRPVVSGGALRQPIDQDVRVMKRVLFGLAIAAVAAATTQPASAAGDAKAATRQVSMCTGCHSIPGYQASFPRVYRVPKIGGQSAAYIEAALRAYAKGERSHPTMNGIAKTLSEQQIADIAAYYAERGAASK
jgi:cytochrome c553